MKNKTLCLFVFLLSFSATASLDGTWVLDGPRTCKSGTKINDAFFTQFFPKYELTFSGNQMSLDMTMYTVFEPISNPCDIKTNYSFTIGTNDSGEDVMSRYYETMESECMQEERMRPTDLLEARYEFSGDSFTTYQVVKEENRQCPKGDSIVMKFKRK